MRHVDPTLVHHRARRPSRQCRPRLEALEDRTLPSILTVTSIADGGPGSLRAALASASNSDTVVFSLPKPSIITLTSGTLNLPLGSAIRIAGPGETLLTIKGNGSFSIFAVPLELGTTTISGLTITGGGGGTGGGIQNFNMFGLTVSNCMITGNSAGISGGGIQNSGPLTLTNCTISQNVAPKGAGINNDSIATIVSSTISANIAGAMGGGISNGATVVIQNSSVVANTVLAGIGGGDAHGGGIYSVGSSSSLSIRNSTISGNSALGGEDGGSGFGGNAEGGGIECEGAVSIVNSSIAGNHAAAGDGAPIAGSNGGSADGGGILSHATSFTLANCTIAGNVAQGGSGQAGFGGDAAGGGIDDEGAGASAINCTIATNHATAGSGSPKSDGGGLFSIGGIFTMQNSIVAMNTAMFEPDVFDPITTTSAYNLIGIGSSANLSNGVNGNQVGTQASPLDPHLGPLANYGGPTQTMALLPGSQAINTGNYLIATTTTDERGLPRFFGTSVDIGAFEFQPLHFLVAGADLGHAPEVKVFDAVNGMLRFDFNAYEPSFLGGVRVAVADMNGDGIPDIITAPGGVKVSLVNVNGALQPSFDLSRGRAPEIKVFSGVDGTKLDDFLAYPSTFKAGVYVAVADVNGDGLPDIITAPDATGQSGHTNVRVFFGGSLINTGQALAANREFNAYDPGFGGGVRLACADLNRDGFADIVVAPGIWSGPDIRVFDGKTLANNAVASKIGEFLAYDFRYFGGVFVATGDVNGDGMPDIITGTNGNGGPEVRAFSGADILSSPTPTIIDDFFAYDPAFNGGARVAVMDVNGDGKADIVTGAGPGGGPHVRIFDGGTGLQLQQNTTDSFMAFDPSFSGGVFVGGA